jgi:hypothetical protein
VVNFAKTHCLIGDHIDGKLVHFVNAQVSAVAVDTIFSSSIKETAGVNNYAEKINVYYLGTSNGKLIKVSSLDSTAIISEWLLDSQDSINEIKIKPVSFKLLK